MLGCILWERLLKNSLHCKAFPSGPTLLKKSQMLDGVIWDKASKNSLLLSISLLASLSSKMVSPTLWEKSFRIFVLYNISLWTFGSRIFSFEHTSHWPNRCNITDDGLNSLRQGIQKPTSLLSLTLNFPG